MEAWGSSSVTGQVAKTALVAAIRHDRSAINLPGAVILRAPEEIIDPDDWIDYYRLATKRGSFLVFKLVGDDLKSNHGTLYPLGGSVKCDDWSSEPKCGNGLHFSPHPAMTHRYAQGTRYLACEVKKKDVVLLGDKLKTPSCKVLWEVDRDGKPMKGSS
jgi:hypothetical protein